MVLLDDAPRQRETEAPAALLRRIAGPDSAQIDFTGCNASLILATMNHTPPFTFIGVTPNPASSEIGVTISNSGSYSYQVYDALGTERLRGECSNDLTLNVAPLPSGIYYLRLSQNCFVQTRHVIIQR